MAGGSADPGAGWISTVAAAAATTARFAVRGPRIHASLSRDDQNLGCALTVANRGDTEIDTG
jgi:hypothetical protein